MISLSNFSFIVAQIVVGQQYLKDCPVNSNIPIYQIVSGSVGLANILLILIVGIVSAAFIKPAIAAAEKNSNADAFVLGLGYCCIICCITMVMILLSIFMLVWTILGLVWLFSSWSTVQYLDPNQATYCNPVMYRFHFWLFILPFILGPVICCIPCCVLCCTLCALPNTSNSAPYTSNTTPYTSSSAPNTSSPAAIMQP